MGRWKSAGCARWPLGFWVAMWVACQGPPPRPVAPAPEGEAARLERACDEGGAEACAALASHLSAGMAHGPDAVGARDERAATLRARACSLNHAASCLALAEGFVAGPEEGWPRALEPLEKACALGAADGCSALARQLRRGVLLAPDLDRARALLERSCASQPARGCAELGHMQERGLGGRGAAAAALDSYARGCRHADADACLALGRATELGRGMTADPAGAFDLYRKALQIYAAHCEGADLHACTQLGTLFREGSGTASNPERGRSLQQDACMAGHAPACSAWMTRGGQFRGLGPEAVGLTALAQSCDRGAGDACFVLGRIGAAAETASGRSPSQLLSRGCRLGHPPSCNAAALASFPPTQDGRVELERACALGDGPGCHHLGLALELDDATLDAAAALEHFRRACRGGYGPACTRVGALRATGAAGRPDVTAALTSWQRGCALGDPRGCFLLGVTLQDGSQVPRNEETGLRNLERACRGGELAACTRLGMRSWHSLDPDGDCAAGLARVVDACERGAARACLELEAGVRRGERLPVDAARLVDLLERAADQAQFACHGAIRLCHEGQPLSPAPSAWVQLAGQSVRVLSSPPQCGIELERSCEQARELLDALCGRNGLSCFRAARLIDRLLDSGLGGRAHERDALDGAGLRWTTKACAGGDARACKAAADAHRLGRGGPPNPARARSLQRRACTLDPSLC